MSRRRPLSLLLISLYFHPARGFGGPVASLLGLCRGLLQAARPASIDIEVLTTDADRGGKGRLELPADGRRRLEPGLTVRYSRRRGGGFFAPALLTALPGALRRADLVLVSGLFVWPLPALLLLARLTGRPLVLSPRGMLLPAALAAKSRKKRLFLALCRLCGLARATFHATSEDEAASIRAALPAARRIAVIPNGVAIPEPEAPAGEPDEPPYLLYLGRLHPHKQPELLLDAFAAAVSGGDEQNGDLRLVLAGDGPQEMRRALEARAERLGIAGRLELPGVVTGPAKQRLLAGATALLLASRSENFGMAVAEALAAATPAIVARTAPWRRLEEERCGYWVPATADGVADGIRRLLDLPADERRRMGERGRAWMEREHSWDSVAAQMLALFEEEVGRRR